MIGQHAVLLRRTTAGALNHAPGIIALVALARERGLETVYVPGIEARGDAAG
jgi:hypothetical protein